MIRMDKYVVFIKRRKERKYKYRREERKREFNETLLQVTSVIAALKIGDPLRTLIKCLKFMDKPIVKGIIAVHAALWETIFTVWKELVAELHGVDIRMLTVTETQLVQVFVELKCTKFVIMRN